MTLLEKINYLNLRPRNAPPEIKVSTFGEWLRRVRRGEDIGVSAVLLNLHCDGLMRAKTTNDQGFAENLPVETPSAQPAPQKKPAKNKNMKKKNPYIEERVIYEGPSTESAADLIKDLSKIPVNPNTVWHDMEFQSIADILPKSPSATPTGFASWGNNGTMKVVGRVVKLNLNDLSYTIDLERAKSGFLVDGKLHKMSDFTEVK